MELFDKDFAFVEQGLDRRRDGTLCEDGKCLPDFKVGTGPIGADGKNLFELVEN